MKCHELVRVLLERKVTLSLRGDGKVKATPPEEAASLIEDMKRYRPAMLALAAGTHKDESFRRTVRKIRIACPELLNDGRCHGCIECAAWSPVWVDGEGPSGICVATPETGAAKKMSGNANSKSGMAKSIFTLENSISAPEKSKRKTNGG